METVINNQLPLDIDDGKRKRDSEIIQKPKVKKANDEVEINSRKKPGRKRLEITESNTKKEKNRVAQRAWRERKEKYVLELEAKILELENAKNKSETEKQQLKLIIEKLRSENTYLKNATSFIFTPTKETELFMEQNKLKILHKKNLKQNNQALLNNSIPLGVQTPVTPELINEPIQSLSTNGINEHILSDNNPEVLNELYKLINVPNSDLVTYQDGVIPQKENVIPISNVNNQETSFNSNIITPNSVINSTCDSSPLCSNIASSASNQNILSTINNANSNNELYNMLSPLQKDNIVIQDNFEIGSSVPTTSTTDPNLLLLMNNQNSQNKDLARILLNQQELNTINSNLMVTSTEAINNSLTANMSNPSLDQNSLFTMTMLNNATPSTFSNMQQSTLSSTSDIQNINNDLYTLNGLELNGVNSNLSKPIVSGSMNYRSESVKEKSQPITDELFSKMIQMLHQQQNNIDVNDEDDLLIRHINNNARNIYSNQVPGIPSPSSTVNYINNKPATPDAIAMGAPYTPEDLDTESNKSGDGDYIISRGIEIRSRGIDLPESDSENGSGNIGHEIKIEDKRSNSSHSTLQFPAEQKPTKLNIPYSVFPRVTQETVDSFINDAKLTEEELECLCSELKNKATCKEKLRYISKNIEVKGWDLETWKKGKIEKLKEEEEKEENKEKRKNRKT